MTERLPFQCHSVTSQLAAREAERTAPTKRRVVFDWIVAHPGGVTDRMIQKALAMNPSTERPRRVELEYAGLIKKIGETAPPGPMNLYEATGAPYPDDPPAGFWGKSKPPSKTVGRLLERALQAMDRSLDLETRAAATEIRKELAT